MTYIGTWYVWGGASKSGVDCSGLIMLAYDAAGIYFPHYSGAMYEDTMRVPLVDIEPGDLLFYGYDGDQHVAMYVGDGKMIEAEMTGTQRARRPGPTRLRILWSRSPAGLAVSGVPTSFHLGPLVFHTYGFGLAIAAYVCFLYARRRLAKSDFDVRPFGKYRVLASSWPVSSAPGWPTSRPTGATTPITRRAGSPSGRAVSRASAASRWPLPVGLYLQRRWWPGSSLARFTDALVPALIAGWALGRVLGPQFMVNGGGHLTHQWFGIHYAGQVGRRVPVPLIQGAEDAILWLDVAGDRASTTASSRRRRDRCRDDRLGSRAFARRAAAPRARVPQPARSAFRSPASCSRSAARRCSFTNSELRVPLLIG